VGPLIAQPPAAGPEPSIAGSTGNSAPLDQWRGLALLLVLISHGFYFTGRVYGIGRVGVNLFFFISGILVFRSLAKSRAATKWDRSRNFWRRRLIRLYPSLITFVIAMAPIVFLGQNRRGLPEHSDFSFFLRLVPGALFYLMNYVTPNISLGHLWSVSCEMQFYLLAPIIFLLGGDSTLRRNIVWGTLLLVLVGFGITQPFLSDATKYHFEFAVWPMMFGFFCEYKKAGLDRVVRPWATLLMRFSLGMLAASLLLMLFGMSMKKVVIAAGVFVFLPCFLSYVTAQPVPGLAGRWLGWTGERTYSIYLWQQPLTICRFLPSVLHPVGALVSVFVGAAWFYVFERPFLSPARRELVTKPGLGS